MKKLIILFPFIFALQNFSLPQSGTDKEFLDSIFAEYTNLKDISRKVHYEQPGISQAANHKCGMYVVNYVKQNFNLFSAEQQRVLKILDGRPDSTQSIVSQSGKFRIHYYTDDFKKPKYSPNMSVEENLSLISTSIDSVYNFEVNYLGYPPPPSDNGMGGDNLYDIYITNLGGSYYGYTEFETEIGGQKFTTFMVIDNDYAGYYTSGIAGAQVTLAHEFHHGIQLGNYIFRSEDTYFYELTSTSMEEFVYDSVNDYYAYMPSYFLNPQNAFSQNDGYNLAIWNIYLKENFGFDLLKRQWQLMPTQRALNAISSSLLEKGSSFKHELNQFGIWTFYTKHRVIPGKYFEEASNYPLVRPLSSVTFTSPDEVVSINSRATANNFIRFVNQQNGKNDSLFVLITNGDVAGAISNVSLFYNFTYYLYDTAVAGTNQFYLSYFSKFSTDNPVNWSIAEIIDTSVYKNEPQLKTDYPYPMPFSYNRNSLINIPVYVENAENVGLYIFSTAMELVYSNNEMPVNKINKNIVSWSVKDNNGEKLASGVYIFVVRSGDKVEKGKLVILHD